MLGVVVGNLDGLAGLPAPVAHGIVHGNMGKRIGRHPRFTGSSGAVHYLPSRLFRCHSRKNAMRKMFTLLCLSLLCVALGVHAAGLTPQELETIQKKAEKGDANAQISMGKYYMFRYHRDYTKTCCGNFAAAVSWYRMAADQGNADAQCALGGLYRQTHVVGRRMESEPVESAKWYHMAAEQGHADAQNACGECYATGSGVKKNPVEAAKWFCKAAEQGNARAQYSLGMAYAVGAGVEKDPKEAVKWVRKVVADEKNNFFRSSPQYFLGLCYAYGYGVEKDKKEAIGWFRKVADAGEIDAMIRLADCYARGDGVEKDPKESTKWYRKAAEQELDDAVYHCGVGISSSSGPYTPMEEFNALRDGAVRGDAMLQYGLGLRYANGGMVKKDQREAVKWFLLAAKQGNADAQYTV